MTQDPIRHYVVLKVLKEFADEIISGYFNEDSAEADNWATRYIAKNVYGPEMTDPPFRTVARPSNDVYSGSERPEKTPKFRELVVALNISGSDKGTSREVVNDIIEAVAEKPDIFAGSSPDIVFAAADHWCIGDASNSIFSDRSAAERLHGVDYLRSQPNTTGEGVNVVIVDRGLDRYALGANYGGGWTVGYSHPGSATPEPGSVRRSARSQRMRRSRSAGPVDSGNPVSAAPPSGRGNHRIRHARPGRRDR